MNKNTHQDFPEDAFDQWIAGQSPPAPSPGFSDRCLATIPLGAIVPSHDNRSNWRFAEALAIAALVWINLAMSASLATDYGFQRNAIAEPNESVETIAERIQGLAPELSAQESQRQAVLLRASESLVCLPNLAPTLYSEIPRNDHELRTVVD